jgi:hypothetical protein
VSHVSQTSSSATVVRDLVAAADRRKRQRAAAKALARTAPVAAGGVLLVGLLGSAAGWPWSVTAVAWIVTALAFIAWAALRTRPRPATDEIATAVDTDAGLHGELRSAHWFASHPSLDPWAAYHLDEAERRARAVAWQEVYPRATARGAWLSAAVLSVAAFALPMGLPTGSWLPVTVPAGAEEIVNLIELESLPPELRDKLLELLAAVRDGKLTPVEAMAELRELTDFAKVDAAMKDQIAQLLDDAASSRDQFEKMNPPSLADAGKMTGDAEWARENMESRLANEQAQKAEDRAPAGEDEKPSDSQEPGPTADQSAEGEAGEASEAQPGAKVPAKPSDTADGASVMMLGNATSAVGEPGSVFGGKRGNVKYGTSQASDIAASLKREMVEAVVNVDQSDLDTEDRRRKTQQSWSSLTYTRGGTRSSFDRARTDAVRPVPEARKPVVERYFVRPETPPPTSEEQPNR